MAAPTPQDSPEELQAAAPGAEEADAVVDPDEDPVKRKFREALERKRGGQSNAAGGAGGDRSKIHGAHGPAAGRRSFRRKSGG
ncbi:DUF5302 domain-containing protein [Streptomyces sp. SL13]|uniref:DUF5302 domain-containing protein n=1 Tax=Streptantibioticus silvisoli TaxID=2705255 RepID=A0AA90JXM7_9ACTN|nr:DUF5302 domain-containing protein [Streptantibioticus silvisoli]MDI5963156.1 DUF5302 domain-containing protein [Streptantibioticus silvisoli]MDI5970331.1 DUF5302 domain-containing protein [Streptantibioticus silvisoli]